MQNQLFVLLIIIGIALVAKMLTTLLHELGHAIPALLLTRQKVTIYIGSFGDPAKSKIFNLGGIEFYFRYNPLLWIRGLCVPSAKDIPLNRIILYTITGPITSLIIAGITFYFSFKDDQHWLLKFSLIIFLGSAILDLLSNLIPSAKPFKLYDGRTIYNDGYRLNQLFHLRRLPIEYRSAVKLCNELRFSEAATLLETMLSEGAMDQNIYRLAVSSRVMEKNYEKAKDISDAFLLTGKMNSDDFSNMALSYSQLGLHEKAMELYDQALQKDPDNKIALNNKGYTLNLMNRFEEAIVVFNKAIELDTSFAYSYCNRGLARIKLGQDKEGLQDINHSLELDKNNSYCFRNLGIYHFDRGNYHEALRLFTKAKEFDNTTHAIDELINDARKRTEHNQQSH